MRQRERRLDPHRSGRAEPIEVLSRLAGRTNFLTPRMGGSGARALRTEDIAHAIAAARDRFGEPTDRLGAAVALAMACQRAHDWPRVQTLGHARLLAHLHDLRRCAELVAPPHQFRARIVMFDAFGDLVRPQRRRNLATAACDARMRRAHYSRLLHECIAWLEAAANTAAADAVRYLFSDTIAYAHERGEPATVELVDPAPTCGPAESSTWHIDLDALCAEALARPRRPGVLRLG